jgi:hypothetical protein
LPFHSEDQDRAPIRAPNTRPQNIITWGEMLAEGHLTRRLFASMVRRIGALAVATAQAAAGEQIGRRRGVGEQAFEKSLALAGAGLCAG